MQGPKFGGRTMTLVRLPLSLIRVAVGISVNSKAVHSSVEPLADIRVLVPIFQCPVAINSTMTPVARVPIPVGIHRCTISVDLGFRDLVGKFWKNGRLLVGH